MLINVKIPTTVGILTFMSRINFMLGRVEHEKSFVTSGPGLPCTSPVSRYNCHNLPMTLWLTLKLLQLDGGSDQAACSQEHTVVHLESNGVFNLTL